ncbi:uncharacterized protein F5147DRAFT_758926 [Suillus discolor]|uniref:DUF6533 domain-containing protein n=1 Tax=Suillus discolor TaxID=1912936 RepID=A0A9P7JXG2_9AGAM|nr:uncharacterized protein F5147DRAFT_758926 [Suillus discolor]KAG2114239.1 hypothetical protein F5147DRAFT_758926 [Suillus discolor]
MEYSTDDVTAARSLQFATYIYTSMAAFWTYDYACSLHEEWSFLLRSQWNKMKSLYIVTRYLPFILLITDLYMSFTSNENPAKCGMLANISSGFGMLLAVCSECFFILRTYALWNRNRILLAAILGTFFSFLAASVSITVDTTVSAAYTTSPIPGITGCYQSSTSDQIFIPFLLFSVFELGLMILTLIRAIQSWRRNSSRLYVVLMNHNIFYYACAFLFSVMNIFTSLLLQDTYRTVLNGFQFLTLAIVAVRMHIHLWQTNQHLCRSWSEAWTVQDDWWGWVW